MRLEKKMNSFRLIGQLVDPSGRRIRKEMSITTAETFDQLSDRVETLLTRGNPNMELDSFMLIPSPNNDVKKQNEPAGISRLAQAMSAAAEALGFKPTEVNSTSVVPIDHAGAVPFTHPPLVPPVPLVRPYVAPPANDKIEFADAGIARIPEPELAVLVLSAPAEETEICLEHKT